MLVNVRLAMMMLAVAAVRAGTELKYVFYDAYNDTTSITYSGGKVLIRCVPYGDDQCSGSEFTLIGPRGEVGKRACENNAAVFHLPIDENMVFGEYKCRNSKDQDSDGTLTLGYRTCSIHEINNTCSQNNSFCLVKGNPPVVHPCETKSPSDCNIPEKDMSICPAGKRSFCHAIPSYADAFAKFYLGNCDSQSSEADFAKVRYNRIEYRYGEPIQLLQTIPTEFLFKTHDESTLKKSELTCVVKKRDGTAVDTKPKKLEPISAEINFEHLFDHGTIVLKLHCEFVAANKKVLASLANYLVVQVTEDPPTVNVTSEIGPNGGSMMRCVQKPPPSDDFEHEFTWYKDGEEIGTGENHEQQGSGSYECSSNTVYKSPAPFVLIRSEKTKKSLAVIPPKPPKTLEPTEPVPVEKQTLFIVLMSVLIPIFVIGIVVAIVCVMKESRRRKEQYMHSTRRSTMKRKRVPATPTSSSVAVVEPSVIKTIKPTDPKEKMMEEDQKEIRALAKADGAMNQVEVDDWAHKNVERAKANDVTPEVGAIDDKHKDDDANLAVVEELPHARYSGELITKKTMVVTELVKYQPDGETIKKQVKMPMNRMSAYEKHPILICQAPIKQEFENQWHTIWAERVGVLVWVGELFDERKQRYKIDPYAPMEKGLKLQFGVENEYGKFVITAVSDPSSAQGCITIFLDVVRTQRVVKMIDGKLTTMVEKDRRQISLLHFAGWPDFQIAVDLVGLSRGIDHMAAQQEMRAKKDLAGMVGHCSAGLQRSISVFVCYIGRQMWLDAGLVNPLGILEYIRRRRAKAMSVAFLTPRRINQQIAMIAAVLRVICSRAAQQQVGDHRRALTAGQSIFNRLEADRPKPMTRDENRTTVDKSSKPVGIGQSMGYRR